jgi:hypothetical protein
MKLVLKRYYSTYEFTCGILYINGLFACHVLEDEARDIKKKSETRIPAGVYKIAQRKAQTDMTEKYRQKYPEFFDYHLELQAVPGFENIYIHVGNTSKDTAGCLLIGDAVDSAAGSIMRSGLCFKRVYQEIRAGVKSGDCTIEILDEENDLPGQNKIIRQG